MESSQFINQTRLSKKQLQFHVQQQQNQKYFLDSPANDNYQQSRCQYFNSVTTPPSAHYPSDFPPNNLSNGHHQTLPHHQANSHCGFEQASPSHRHNNIKKFHQSDPNSIEVCIDYENQHNSQRVGVDPSSIKWNRRNIAATMEKYEPTVKHHQSPNHRGHVTLAHKPPTNGDYLNDIHHSDYAYAYYEPGAPMRHQNIPAGYYEEAGPSRPPPPNSIRALLSTARKNNMQRTSGKYSLANSEGSSQHGPRSQENVYEEIHDAEKRKMLRPGESIMSLNQSLVEEEFRRVHNRHQRVLGELNLSVEEMLMPPPPSAFIPATATASPMSDHQNDPMDFLGNGEVIDGSSGAGNCCNNNVDLDSGFSGSNSSYIGSLRYQKSSAAAAMKAPIIELPINHQHTDSGSSFYGYGSTASATDEIGMISLSSRSSSSLFESGKKSKPKSSSPSHQGGKLAFWKTKGWKSKLPGFSSTSSINKIGMDEQKPISWEDPLPRSNSISSTTNTFNPQAVTRKSSNSIISLPQRQHSYNLNSVNNNQETSFYNPQVLNLNNINNNHLINSNGNSNNTSPSNPPQHLNKTHKKLEHTPSARSTISSEDSWCPSEDHDNDDISSCNDDDDNLSDRSTSLISAARNSQLRLTFNKAKQHLSFDKWRNNSTTTMPSSNNQESPGEPLSRLSRWFSIRRGSHQYDLNASNSPNRSGSIEKENDEKLANGKKMPQLQETEEDHSQPDGASPLLSQQARMERRTTPLVLPPAPANLSQSQLKRRHIISAIVHSENSYVQSLQRLVKDYKKPLEESNPPILNGSKMSVLFHRVPDILQCHTLFRFALTECIRNWDRDEKIGDVFMGAFSKTNVLDVYSGFINNFSNAMDLAKVETKRKSAFADFLNVKQISAHDRLSFFGLMVKPVQRFPQFILFLQDLLKYTPQGHHDRTSLQMALTQLESLADSLNERKREAEQYQAYKEMLGQISGPFNTRFISGSSDQRHNYLLREDNVTQLEFSQNGMLVKSKPRRLLLANDKVICVSVAPKASQDFGSTEKLSLKWMYHVNDVEIVDNATSATLNRYITSGLNRGGSLKSNHSGSGNEMSANSSQLAAQLTNGAENLANEMSSLMHDYNVMSRVNDLVGQLKGDYPEISLNITKNVLNTIQTSIRKKDEEMAWVDSCCLQLIVKQKSGKEETLTFRTDNPNVKKEWITELRLAQLALDTNNSPAWEVGDRDIHQRPLTKMPLFVRMHPVYKSTQHQTEVRCGCYYSMSPESKFQKRATKNRYYLWTVSVDGSSSHITILMHQPHQAQAMIKDVTAFSLNETVITAMDFVRGRVGLPDSTAGGDMDCVWLGTSTKKLIIYGGTNPEQEKQIIQLNVPETPTQILFHVNGESVFVALANGDILMYRKEQDVWNLKHYQLIKLESFHISITSILAINMNIYAASGRKIFVLNGITGDVQKSFEIQHVRNDVNLMAHAGVGLWISLKSSSIICLYHTETFKHLQDINIAPHILRVTSSSNAPSNASSPSIYVTALMACKGLLWVGTNVGITLTVPLPRLEGLPIISGNVNISYHAHCGPVTFFLPLITKTATQAAQMQVKAPLKGDQITTPHDDSNNNIEIIDKNGDMSEKEEVVKLEKQRSLDISPSPAKMKNQLPNSPIVLRRKSNIRESDLSRMSKTLPRGFSGVSAYFNGTNSMRSSSSSGSSQNGSESGCDVYGLYSDLLFVKEDYDGQLTPNTNLGIREQVAYDTLRRGNSDPDLAAIPSKVSTLDRRLKMKVGRPRSLDLSNWSVDSRSSSLYTSSGSEESMGVKYRSVSRNSSNASHKFNGTELMNINECEQHQMQVTSTPTKIVHNDEPQQQQDAKETSNNFSAATLKNNKRKNLKNNYHQQMIDGRRTVLMVMGGRGYVNWRNVFNTPPNGPKSSSNVNGSNGGMNSEGKQQSYHLRSNSLTSTINYKMLNSTDANIIIWEKKL